MGWRFNAARPLHGQGFPVNWAKLDDLPLDRQGLVARTVRKKKRKNTGRLELDRMDKTPKIIFPELGVVIARLVVNSFMLPQWP
jgi:hypothetical protein